LTPRFSARHGDAIRPKRGRVRDYPKISSLYRLTPALAAKQQTSAGVKTLEPARPASPAIGNLDFLAKTGSCFQPSSANRSESMAAIPFRQSLVEAAREAKEDFTRV